MPLPLNARNRAGDRRDHTGDERDQAAERRDRAADLRDEAAERSEGDAMSSPGAQIRARLEAASDRRQACQDRRSSASARRESELDRTTALADRGAWAQELHDAGIDGLTGVLVRSSGMTQLHRRVVGAHAVSQPLIVAFVDVDGLKAVNDSKGHAAGDRLLIEVATCLVTTLRATDLVVRVGGDEFVCALGGITKIEATALFVQVKTALAQASQPGAITVGLAQLRSHESTGELLARADAELYRQRRQRRRAHEVVFYADDEQFCSELARFLSEGVQAAEQVVAIVTPSHRRHLQDTGCVLLDAQQTLNTFMDASGLPDVGRFDSVVGALVRGLASRGTVRAYGEMVAVLWEQGNILGALRLEELWNDLGAEVAFHLRCAYPLAPGQDPTAAGMGSVCRLHSHVQNS